MPINWEVRALRGKTRYQHVYLAYLDVLGFKNLMHQHAEKSPRFMVKLFEKIDDAVNHPRVSGLVQRYLSDSILMWSTDPASLPYMFEVCRTLQDEMLLEGCLVRGAIVFGKHYYANFDQLNLATGERDKQSGEVIISPALIKAYLIESGLRQPVIKVEARVAADYDALAKGLPKEMRPPKLRHVPSQLYDLPSYLMSGRFSLLHGGVIAQQRPSKDWQRHPGVRKDIAALRQIRKNILVGVRNPEPRISTKWKYVRIVFDARVRPLAKRWDLLRGITIGKPSRSRSPRPNSA